MLISIAIPTYNNENTIAKAIKSAIYQDYNDEYEILIVNNASTDRTQEIIDSFNDDRIRVVINKETCDMYSNHNICLKEAKGDYVLFCHSDDKLTQDALLILKRRIEERLFPSKYILWGRSMFRDFQTAIGQHRINTMFSGESSINCFIWGGLTPSGTCYSRKSLLDLGGFPTIDAKIPMSDWAILVTAAYNYFEFEMIDRLLFIREHASTANNNFDKIVWQESIIASLDSLVNSLNEQQFDNFIKVVKENNKSLFFWYKKFMSETELRKKNESDKRAYRKQKIKRLIHMLLRI